MKHATDKRDVRNRFLAIGVSMMVVGALMLLVAVILALEHEGDAPRIFAFLTSGLLLIPSGAYLAVGRRPKETTIKGTGGWEKTIIYESDAYYDQSLSISQQIEPKVLDESTESQRRAYARGKKVPGEGAPPYNVLRDRLALKVVPISDRMVPMYMLDSDFRIVDWNEAFSVAFDRTMEGRRGQSVLEWTYFLDNYEEVLNHGEGVFSSPDKIPPIDIEEIVFTSKRYGRIEAEKRAYRIPEDKDSFIGWLVILKPTFCQDRMAQKFRHDLIRILGLDQLWSEYALSYDRVLTNTKIYPQLLSHIVGKDGRIQEIAPSSRVLDLGAGTGNITYMLAEWDRNLSIYAVENNWTMLEILKSKCASYLQDNEFEPGVIPVKQDITSLGGLQDEDFDYAIMNNVLYSTADPLSSLREACRVIRPGGEIRIGGPRKDTDLDKLFMRIKDDLLSTGKFEDLKDDYLHVESINKYRLKPLLHKFDIESVAQLVLSAGFTKITYKTVDAYAGQAMIVCAQK